MITPGVELLRGRPRFVSGPTQEDHRVVALVPEVRVVTRRPLLWRGRLEDEVRPVAVLELHADGLTRHRVVDPSQALIGRLALAGLGVLLLAGLVRIFVNKH